MKLHKLKITLGLLMMLVVGAANGQTLEFAPVGAEWHYERQTMFTRGYIKISVTQDTIIEGHTCSVLQKEEHGYNYYSQNLYHFDGGREYITQEDDSVLVYRKGRFYKLFDFGAVIGDSWVIPGYLEDEEDGRVIMCGKGTEFVDGNELRYILIADVLGSPYGYGNGINGDTLSPPDTIKVFERIGPIDSYLFPEQETDFDYSEGGLLRCYHDDIIDVNYSWPFVNCDYINDNNVGVDENMVFSDYIIFPNPTTKSIWISLSDKSPISICIYDIYGRIIYTEVAAGSYPHEINLDFLNPGMYCIIISNNKNTISSTIIKI